MLIVDCTARNTGYFGAALGQLIDVHKSQSPCPLTTEGEDKAAMARFSSEFSIKDMITRAAQDVSTFNSTHKRSALSNCYLWERLAGNRLDSVRGWIDRQVIDKDEEVLAAVEQLTSAAAAA